MLTHQYGVSCETALSFLARGHNICQKQLGNTERYKESPPVGGFVFFFLQLLTTMPCPHSLSLLEWAPEIRDLVSSVPAAGPADPGAPVKGQMMQRAQRNSGMSVKLRHVLTDLAQSRRALGSRSGRPSGS